MSNLTRILALLAVAACATGDEPLATDEPETSTLESEIWTRPHPCDRGHECIRDSAVLTPCWDGSRITELVCNLTSINEGGKACERYMWQPTGERCPDKPKGKPAIAYNWIFLPEQFRRGPSGDLQRRARQFPFLAWSEWESLGGYLVEEPAVGRNADARLEAFVVGGDRAVYHKWQHWAGGPWSDWARLPMYSASRPAVGVNQDGRLEVFVRGYDGGIWHAWQGGPNGGWSDAAPLGGWTDGDPDVVRNADGRLEVFTRGMWGDVYHQWQYAPNSGWVGATSLDGPWARQIQAHEVEGRLGVIATAWDGGEWINTQECPGCAFGGWRLFDYDWGY